MTEIHVPDEHTHDADLGTDPGPAAQEPLPEGVVPEYGQIVGAA